MNDTDDNFFLLFIRKTLMFFSSRKWLTILNKRLYEGAIDRALYANCIIVCL